MIISLTGFMGCGKSSVGRRLSELLCCPFMDLDDVIVEHEGRSIPDIFAAEGEAAFRLMELEALMGILSTSEPRQCAPLAPSHCVGPSPYAGVRKCQFRTNALTPIENPSYHLGASSCHPERSEGSINLILALGGGTVMTPECAELVRENTVCIYLRASVDTLMQHLESESAGRPLLKTDNADNHSERVPDCHSKRVPDCHSKRVPDCHFERASDCHFERVPNCHFEQTSDCHFERAERVEKSNKLRRRIETLMQQRSSTYEKTAHITIDTDGKSVEALASEIAFGLDRLTSLYDVK